MLAPVARLSRILIVSTVTFAAMAGSARAATTIGVPTASLTPGDHNICVAMIQCTYYQETTAAAPVYTAPVSGVIVRWRIGGGTPGPVRLRVIRPLGSGTFTGAGTGIQQTTTGGVVDVFPDRLPISAGDTIGVDNDNSALIFTEPFAIGLRIGDFDPFLSDGASPIAPTGSKDLLKLQVNADIEADADNDGFGDETQDRCVGVTGSINGCPKGDLRISSQTASTGAESDLVTYAVTITNDGPDPVPDAAVIDALPAGARALGGGVQGGKACPAPGGGRQACPVGALAVHASATVTVAAALRKGTNTNVATTSSAELTKAAADAPGAGDPNPANDSRALTTSVSAPTLGAAAISAKRFRLGNALPKISRKTPVGITVSFRLSEPGRVTFAFARSASGRCAKRKGHRRCSRPTQKLVFQGHAGNNRVRFSGRLSRRVKLAPGSYLLTITASDTNGNSSSARKLRFSAVR